MKLFENLKRKQIGEALVIIKTELNDSIGPVSRCDAQTREKWLRDDELLLQAKRISELYAEINPSKGC